MLGNDIVDLSKTRLESNWQRKGFLEKLFTSTEQSLIHDLASVQEKELAIWLMWSMKESAYKYFMRDEKRRFYAPRKFECQFGKSLDLLLLESSLVGTVTFFNKSCSTNSLINDQYIYTSTKSEIGDIMNYFHQGEKDSRIQKITSCLLLSKAISQYKDIAPSKVKVVKDQLGIPSIFINSKPTNIPCSISHHGRFIGVSFIKK